jgi:hypothetical protein
MPGIFRLKQATVSSMHELKGHRISFQKVPINFIYFYFSLEIQPQLFSEADSIVPCDKVRLTVFITVLRYSTGTN